MRYTGAFWRAIVARAISVVLAVAPTAAVAQQLTSGGKVTGGAVTAVPIGGVVTGGAATAAPTGAPMTSAIIAAPQQLPSGGSVAAGSASIGTPHNGTLDINQSSNRAVLDWHSFSIGQGGTVNFNQPGASSATLNRVTGNTPSSIAGTINAPGTVLLVNPNGIAITKYGVINTGSFAASTLDIKNSDFMSGNYKFTGNGNSAAVTNAGRINVSDGGFAALLGGQVANDGIITRAARQGRARQRRADHTRPSPATASSRWRCRPRTSARSRAPTAQTLVTNRGKIRRRRRRRGTERGDGRRNLTRRGQRAGLDPAPIRSACATARSLLAAVPAAACASPAACGRTVIITRTAA